MITYFIVSPQKLRNEEENSVLYSARDSQLNDREFRYVSTISTSCSRRLTEFVYTISCVCVFGMTDLI